MAGYTTTQTTDWDRETAFDYLADFTSVSDWDPGIPRSELLSVFQLAFNRVGDKAAQGLRERLTGAPPPGA